MVVVRGSVDFARVVVLGPGRWLDSAYWPASAANAGLLAGKRHCNSALVDDRGETIAHSLSEGSAGVETAVAGLDRPGHRMDTEGGPREVLLPKVKPRRRAQTLLRGVFTNTSFNRFKITAGEKIARNSLLPGRKVQSTTGAKPVIDTDWPASTKGGHEPSGRQNGLLPGRPYGQFIQPICNFALEHSLRIAHQAAFGRLTGRRLHPILRISLEPLRGVR